MAGRLSNEERTVAAKLVAVFSSLVHAMFCGDSATVFRTQGELEQLGVRVVFIPKSLDEGSGS